MMARTELRARPRGGGERVAVERVVRATQRSGVVVAEHDDRAARRVLLDQLEHRNGICAVADMIAEERVTARPERIRVREASRDGLEIAVNVGEQSELQGELVSRMR